LYSDEYTEPPDIVDRLLWRDAQHILGRHAAEGADGACVWCGWPWPCPPRRLAERAEVASRHHPGDSDPAGDRPWHESWTARHDLNGLRSLPSWRTDHPGRVDRPPPLPTGRTAARGNLFA
jgi:hypothetical protein